MRLLHAARLSRLADGATGPDKQDEAAQRYAAAYGHEIVGVASDTDVSGSVSPFERPQLGPWLATPDRYDGIVASHLDRLGRNVRHLTDLHRWAEDNGKRLITVDPSIDWQSDVGQLIWGIMAWLAEQELKAITRRNRETQAWLRSNGYLVGKAPFGFRIVASGDHKQLAPDPATAPIVTDLAERFVSGESLSTLAAWLNDAAPRANGGQWWPETVSKMLRNPIFTGRRKDGLRVPRIIPPDLWARVQAERERREPAPRSAPANDTLLSALLRCGRCHGPMYKHNAKGVPYYYCRNKRQGERCRNTIKAEIADAAVEESILAYGHLDYFEPRVVPGNGHDEEIAEVVRDIRELDPLADDYDARLSALRAELAQIRALPAEPARTELVATGQKVADRWEALDIAGRRRMLVDLGYTGESVFLPGVPRMTAIPAGRDERGKLVERARAQIEPPPMLETMARLSGQSIDDLL